MIPHETSILCLSLSPFAGSRLSRCNKISRSPAPILRALAVIASLAVFCALPAAKAHAQAVESVVTVSEHTPPQVLNGMATPIGHYNSAQKLRLTLAIKPPHMAEEEEFLRELTDRTSPNFHQFLSPEEWNARFAPSAQDEQAVVDWATSQGFTITKRFNHRLIVDVEAPAAVIEKAFGVTINSYQVGEEADFSNDRDPVIPAHLQGILFNIQGLNNIQHDHGSRPGPQTKAADYAEGPAYAEGGGGHADAISPRPAANSTSNNVSNSTLFTNGYANPTEIFSSQVYNYDGLQNLGHCCNPHNDSGGTPNVSNIAIAAFGNVNGSDVVGFAAAYPYLAYDWTYYDIDGSINCTTDPGDCPSGETTQDTEWTIATANSFGSYLDTSHIYVYIGGNYNNSTFTDIYSDMLNDSTARVFTTSWSCTEVYGCSTSTMDARHNIFNSMVGQGWTLIAASGDRGSADDCNFNDPAHETTAYPGTDYDVLAAGGTQLLVYSDGTWDYEHGWQGGFFSGACHENDGGSGGGVSSYYGKPGFQGYSTWNSQTKRSTPDISLNALGIGQNLYINGNLQCCANGTSIVAPELAGFFAQENAYLNYIGNICGTGTSACTPVGNPMPQFYAAGFYNDASHFPFYDMVGSYCNDNDATVANSLGYYCDQTGWDNVTGWGSANMLQLAWAINWQLIPANGTPGISWSGPTTGKWYNTDQIVSWTIIDYSGGAYPGTGIAGFTQGWDSIPPDTFTEAHGGTGDTFWSGPEYPNYNTGCLSFAGAGGCAGGASQGCHTAHVRGWNNQGWTTGDTTYGSVCYDTVAPTITASTNPVTSYYTWVHQSVVVTLTPTDPGGSNASGISTTYYAINSVSCYPGSLGSCSIYTGPFTVSGQQQSYIYYFTVDKAGNYSTEPYIWVSIDLTAPVTTASLSGTVYGGSIYKTAVQVTLNASDTGGSGVLHTYYQLDGGSTITYGSAFTVSALGNHSVKYWSTDGAGNVESAKTVSFSIDSTAALTSPAPGSTLSGTSATFSWTAGVGPTIYRLRLGTTGAGSSNVYNAAGSTTTALSSPLITGIPAYGAPLYARLCSWISSAWQCNDYTYTESGTAVKAVLTTPTPGSTLSGTSATFSWTAGGGVSIYRFRLGTTGAGSSNVYNAAGSTTTALSSPLITGIPAYGAPLYARLCSWISSAWQCNDYTYTESGSGVKAVLTSPTPGSTLAGTSDTFTWTAGGGVTEYRFRLGTTGPGSSDVYNAAGSTTTALSSPLITGIPAYGAPLYARLCSWISSAWQCNDYTYTESGAPVKAVLTTPTPGSTLTGSSATFSWTAGGGVTIYRFRLGTTGPGSSDVYNAAGSTTTALTTGVVSGIPTTGGTVYARLSSWINGAWQNNDYTYTEQ